MKLDKIGFKLDHQDSEQVGHAGSTEIPNDEVTSRSDWLDYWLRVLIDFCVVYGGYAAIRDLINSLL